MGKTTLQEQTIQRLLVDRNIDPKRILRVQFDDVRSLLRDDDPILGIVRWYEALILGKTLNEAAHEGKPAFLFFDEVQNLRDWAPQLKSLVDHSSVRVMVTGSSALRIERGRDSLAGRITTLDMGTLLLREIAGLRFGVEYEPRLAANGLEPLLDREFWRRLGRLPERERADRDRAFQALSLFGGYPLAHASPDATWPEIADQLNENVIRRVIEFDLRMGDRGRKRNETLLREVFRAACRYAGQAPSRALLVDELKRVYGAEVGWQSIANYLSFLDGALLLRLIHPLELRLKRRRGQPKLCVVDLGLRASWLQEVVPLDPLKLAEEPHLADLAGHLAENAVGAFLGDLPHLQVSHFPERASEPEVDFVLTIGTTRIPLEVKYRRRVDPQRDTLGLRSFLEHSQYNAPFGILVTMFDEVDIRDPRIVPISLPSLLWMR